MRILYVLSILTPFLFFTSCIKDSKEIEKPIYKSSFIYKVNEDKMPIKDYSAVYSPSNGVLVVSGFSSLQKINKEDPNTDNSYFKNNVLVYTNIFDEVKSPIDLVNTSFVSDSLFYGPDDILFAQNTFVPLPNLINEEESYFHIKEINYEEKLVSGYFQLKVKDPNSGTNEIKYFYQIDFKNLPYTETK